MAVERQFNWLSQERIDLPHLRSVESAVAADFDVLAGRAMAGSSPVVVRGFEVLGIGSNVQASSLQLNVANGIVFNQQATESGTFLWVPGTRAIETLDPITNSKVSGGWSPSSVNYVGIDFSRTADNSTIDLAQFIDANTKLETPKQVPLGKTLDYVIQISTLPFSATPNVIPIALVTLSATNTVTSITDARPLMFRLGSGGDLASRSAFFTKWSRKEGYGTLDNTLFTGGDKFIQSQKDWQDAVMTRLWELGGGEFWYSGTADRNVRMLTWGTPLANGDYWSFAAPTLTWQGIRLVFDNSTAYSVDIAPGSATIQPGQALYVDIDRSQFYVQAWVTATAYVVGDLVSNLGNAYQATTAGTSAAAPTGTGTGIVDGTVVWKYVGPAAAGTLVPQVADLQTLGTGTPNSRWVLAVRRADRVFTRDWRYPVGTLFIPATTTAQGVLKISRDYTGLDHAGTSGLNDPIAISDRGGVITVPSSYVGNGLSITGGQAAGTTPLLSITPTNGISIWTVASGGVGLSRFEGGAGGTAIELYTKDSWLASHGIGSLVKGNGGLWISADLESAALPANPPYVVNNSGGAHPVLLSGKSGGGTARTGAIQIVNTNAAGGSEFLLEGYNTVAAKDAFTITGLGEAVFGGPIWAGVSSYAGGGVAPGNAALTVYTGNAVVTVGNLSVDAGALAVGTAYGPAGSVSAASTITAGTGMTATTGNITVTAGQFVGKNATRAFGNLVYISSTPAFSYAGDSLGLGAASATGGEVTVPFSGVTFPSGTPCVTITSLDGSTPMYFYLTAVASTYFKFKARLLSSMSTDVAGLGGATSFSCSIVVHGA